MKAIRLLLATLLAIVGATTGWAQTNYGMEIGGVPVTSANYTNISSSNGFSAVKSGTVTFDLDTKTLTLNGATIRTSGSTYPPLEFTNTASASRNVVLVGENTLTSVHNPSLKISRNVTISGNGSLSLNATEETGIYVTSSSMLTIEGGCSVDAQGIWGIAGVRNSCQELLVINGANVKAKGTGSDGSICDLKSLTLTDCSITSPSGAVWNNTKHAVCDASGNIITSEVTITSQIFVYNNLIYRILPSDDSKAWIKGYVNGMVPSQLTIPGYASYNGKTFTVTGIDYQAFMDCPITKVTIPSTIDSIAPLAFFGTGLKTFEVASINAAYSSYNGLLYNKAKTR